MTESAPALIIMAAGIGSRYGGLKQIDPIGPNGEIVMDYAIYDALRAGFGKVVFVIREEIEEAFREKIGKTIEQRISTTYVLQDIRAVPAGVTLPAGRQKPWGTGQAVLACQAVIHEPFAVINADDFYGQSAFTHLADFLRQPAAAELPEYAMIGYILRNTLSEHGSVARGVCQIGTGQQLSSIRELTKIQAFGEEVRYSENGVDWLPIDGDRLVSMNMWGFPVSFMAELAARFPVFFQENAQNLQKAEFFLPNVVNALLTEGKARVRVLPTTEKWFGVTYPEDRQLVQQAIQRLIRQGSYPEQLWP